MPACSEHLINVGLDDDYTDEQKARQGRAASHQSASPIPACLAKAPLNGSQPWQL